MYNLKAALKFLVLIVWMSCCFGPVWLAYKFKKYHLRDRLMRFSSCLR